MRCDYLTCEVCGKHTLGKDGKCLVHYIDHRPQIPPEAREVVKMIKEVYAIIKAGELSAVDTLNGLLDDYKNITGKDYHDEDK